MSGIDWSYWLAGDGVEARDTSGLYVVARRTKGYVVPLPRNAREQDVVVIQWNGQADPFRYTAERLASDVRNISAERRQKQALSRETQRMADRPEASERFVAVIDGVIGFYTKHSAREVAKEAATDAWLTNDPQDGDTLDVEVIGPVGSVLFRAVCRGSGDEFSVEVSER